MSSFLKIFLASLLALIVFTVAAFFLLVGMAGSLASSEKPTVGGKAILVVNLEDEFKEIAEDNPIAEITAGEENQTPALYDLLRLIRHAKSDSAVKGIYLRCGSNANGFATGEAIREALADFKSANKFVIAYGDVITQGGYRVGNVASKIYCNPKGGVDWKGYAMQLLFLKGTLEKLDIQPQIFYAGKFKSATEPFRETKMTDANRQQSTELMNGLYEQLLLQTAEARKLDTATLHRYANENLIRSANDAVKYGLVDGLKYDDEVKDEIKQRTGSGKYDKINFITAGKYMKAVDYKKSGKSKIAVIYAQGDIIDGKGEKESIGSESYRTLVRKARLDKDIKAIVFRINSGGGSALASEVIWRELTLAKADKPVIVSFGDVAASGGYYLACNADSIFAEHNTITGSIGVFTLIPNMQGFFNKKLGVTFDGVKTSPDADAMTVSKPLTESQKRFLQNDIDSTYHTFKSRVAEGRKLSIEYVDSVGQGRVWIGSKAVELGLVDRIGGLDQAVACAARMAKITDYRLREYPDKRGFLDMILGSKEQAPQAALRQELGEDGYRVYQQIKKTKNLSGKAQARMPFELVVE
ncbi:signal peptide peptidase SppA [Pseudobacter ginsenosidimutans]|uniref:Protease-4 n=1 Tax=Pseudobacter ginsenosidimutans TaxID=661488 RepID=A0A4Q7MCJ8_9BACT|nr:signal peptide peptidase SppA [Pseudobacter ginsenosidimutans]QEC42726.1 signal peptide peptidase SppA [Pseudobacter ginsenosidimutans]RZS65117.1 protease-4 [Pseudobacter ginsenosidimutans]